MSVIRRAGLALAGLVLLGAGVALPAAAQETFPADLEDVVGLAWDRDAQELYVADPGGAVRVLDAEGAQTDTVELDEPLESLQGVALFEETLYLGDIGDDSGSRDSIAVVSVPREAPEEQVRYEFTYPDGNHDARALLVSGRGRIYIITDGQDPGIYRASLDLSPTGPNALVRALDAPEGVTDAAFLYDGATMLIRTDDGVQMLDAFSWEVVAETTYVDGRPDESITQYGEGRILVGDSEQLRIESIPRGVTTMTPSPVPTPSPESSPEASPTSTAEQSPTSEPQEPPEPEVAMRGTILALVGAAVVALLASVVVLVSRDR